MDKVIEENIDTVIDKLLGLLRKLEIEYKLYKHGEVFNMEDISNLDMKFEGEYCKNLFLRNSKGDIHYLLVIQESKKADLKELARNIGSTRLSFASDERLYKYLGLRPGSVTPFGIINDLEGEVIVLLDSDLVNLDKVNFHPNTNAATITVSYEGLNKFLQHQGNTVKIVNIQ